MKLAENSLTVAESLRDNYFKNTAKFVAHLRGAMRMAGAGKRSDSILETLSVDDADWSDLQGEVVTFMDGGIGEVEISGQVPILLRVGSYSVRTGERRLAEREQFGYYPVILGNLEGGSKDRKDFVDVVRITAELLGGLSAMVRNPDLRVLMFHGPLVYLTGQYAGHAPFTEDDINIFLGQYAQSSDLAEELKEQFLEEARLELYPQVVPGRSDELIKRRLFEPLCWMAFLYRKLVQEARKRDPVPIIAGVVERGTSSGFSREILLPRIFHGLRERGNENYFNDMYGRTDLKTSESLLARLGYTDALLLAMLLSPGQATESWPLKKFDGLRKGTATLPGESFETQFDWSPLRPPAPLGFPPVRGCYVHNNETTEPIRIEVFEDLGEPQVLEAARRVYLYSRLLPGYGFPVGLDIADKHAHIPAWLTEAYGKLIRHHLGVSLQRGEISDAEMRHILVQAIYMTHRDWLYRPGV
jgi:hypothetical protein